MAKPGETVTLRSDRARVCVRPSLGGSLSGFWWETPAGRIDWLRPGPSGKAPPTPTELSCFPLVPFSNRIRDGKFEFQGRPISLPPNWAGSAHPIHGYGWQSAWSVEKASKAEAVLAFEYAGGAWPFPFQARQTIGLEDEALRIEIEISNLGETDMPAGLGLHPYFPRRPGTRVSADVTGMWETDHDVLPLGHGAAAPVAELAEGVAAEAYSLDNVFTGWNRKAVLHWPDKCARLTVTATPPFDFLVVFTPAGEDFFCVEPVSHSTDAANSGDDAGVASGWRVLPPGAALSGAVTFAPSIDA